MDLVLRRVLFAAGNRQDANPFGLQAVLQRLLDRAGRDLEAKHIDHIGHAPAQRQPAVLSELPKVTWVEVSVAKELMRGNRVIEIAVQPVVDAHSDEAFLSGRQHFPRLVHHLHLARWIDPIPKEIVRLLDRRDRNEHSSVPCSPPRALCYTDARQERERAKRNIPASFPVRSRVVRAAAGIHNHKRCSMRRKLITGGLVLTVGLGCVCGAVAQVKPETLVDQRVSAMRLQGKYFYGSLLPMAQGKIPYDASIAARNAGYLEVLAKMPWDGFEPSTKDLKTRALPEVYSEPAKFKAAQDSVNAELGKLVAATKTGNEANVKAAILDVSKACGACHDNFRAKQQ